MPIIKPISGHTGCKGIRRYLIKNDRALAVDYLNLDAPVPDAERDAAVAFDWATAMDATRHAFGNDAAWRGKRVRTYKHYVFSPDPDDETSLESLRDIALAWARENFADYEVAIVYHDDNEGHIPHAHVVVNNTNLISGNRLQDPDPRALKRSAQNLAKARGMHYLKDQPSHDRFGNKMPQQPRTHQQVYTRRAETELAAKGQYSWVADIRARVGIARSVAINQNEFESVLASLGVSVAENSSRAQRHDWIYSLASRPTWRISGEKLGLSYGREAVTARLTSGGIHLDEASERQIVALTRQAYAVGNLDELHTLAAMVDVNERERISCIDDYDRTLARLRCQPEAPRLEKRIEALAAARDTAARTGTLPQHTGTTSASTNQGRVRRSGQQPSGRVHRDTRDDARTAERTQPQTTPIQEPRKDDAR